MASASWTVGPDWTVSPEWTLSGQNPVAAFTLNATLIYEGDTVAFNGSDSYDPDGTVTAWAWDFGDGNATTGETANNTFVESGVYAVRLTVTDNSALTDDVSHDVTVLEAGASPTGMELGFGSFGVNSRLGFMCDLNRTVELTVTDGTLASQDVTATIQHDEGYFTFVADSPATMTFAISNLFVTVKGDQGNDVRRVGDAQSVTVEAGDSVVIHWYIGIEDWISPFIMPMLGLSGFGLMMTGVVYVGQKIREHEWFDAIKGIFLAFILILVGAGLLIGWLW